MARRARKWNTVSPNKLAAFVRINPGLTASMIAILWRRPYGTISAVLHGMTERHEITRRMEQGMRGGTVKAWRYYDNILGAVDSVLDSTYERAPGHH